MICKLTSTKKKGRYRPKASLRILSPAPWPRIEVDTNFVSSQTNYTHGKAKWYTLTNQISASSDYLFPVARASKVSSAHRSGISVDFVGTLEEVEKGPRRSSSFDGVFFSLLQFPACCLRCCAHENFVGTHSGEEDERGDGEHGIFA